MCRTAHLHLENINASKFKIRIINIWMLHIFLKTACSAYSLVPGEWRLSCVPACTVCPLQGPAFWSYLSSCIQHHAWPVLGPLHDVSCSVEDSSIFLCDKGNLDRMSGPWGNLAKMGTLKVGKLGYEAMGGAEGSCPSWWFCLQVARV